MKHRRTSLIVLLLAVVMACSVMLSACSSNETPAATDAAATDVPGAADAGKTEAPAEKSDKPVTVVLAQAGDPPSMDPHRTSGDVGANVFRNINESLTTYNADDELIPCLAKSWEQTSENEWVFHLQEGVTFSNGNPFNAEAVVWNLDRGASTEYPRQAFEYVTYYDHAEAVDEYTVKIVTKTPDNLLDCHMCDINIIDPVQGEEVGEEGISLGCIGTGPYVLESWTQDQQIVLQANPNYWGGEPEVDTYIIKTIPEAATRVAELINGTVDIIYDVNFEYIPMLEGDSNVRVENKITRRVCYIAFNTCDWSPTQALKDVRVRQAINYAVDKEAIIENIMGGFAGNLPTIWRKDFPGYDASVTGYTYDPEKAKALLAEAGYANGFDVAIQCSDGLIPKATEICQAVASYLSAVGINATVEPMELNTMRSVVINGQSEQKAAGMFMWSWASKPKLCDSWLTGIVHSTGMSSYNCIEGYDALVDQILATTTLAEKDPLYAQMQQMLVDNPPYLYLFQQGSIYATSSRLDWSPVTTQFLLAREMSVK